MKKAYRNFGTVLKYQIFRLLGFQGLENAKEYNMWKNNKKNSPKLENINIQYKKVKGHQSDLTLPRIPQDIKL
jgi:hypothetical protein